VRKVLRRHTVTWIGGSGRGDSLSFF